MVSLSREAVEITIGALLLLVGWFVPLGMTIRVIPPSLALSFGSYAMSLIGLIVGTHGIYTIILIRRSKQTRDKAR